MAGGLVGRVMRPASVRIVSKPLMMLAPQACACCACQVATRAASVAGSRSGVPSATDASSMSRTLAPRASIGSMRSLRQASPWVSASRRMPSPITRSCRSTDRGLIPLASNAPMYVTRMCSSSRMRSSGVGSAPPVVSRATSSRFSGTPARSLTWRNVSSLNVAKRW